MDIITKYFPEFSETQLQQFDQLEELFKKWNQDINVVSRKDIVYFRERHLLHCLSVCKIINFVSGTKILDIGTGGGLPGIPLAIIFPHVDFLLVDSIGKKIKVAQNIVDELKLHNVVCRQARAEEINCKCDFVVSRGVTSLPLFLKYTDGKFLSENKNTLPNGIIYLKGGDYQHELDAFNNNYRIFCISDFFDDEFFKTKEIVWIQA